MAVTQYNHTSGSMENGIVITPNNTTLLETTRGLWVGVSGNIAVQHVAGTTVTYLNVPVGIFPMSVVRVMVATTASSIVALY